jgi:capsular polysaccharide biosynthesis protein
MVVGLTAGAGYGLKGQRMYTSSSTIFCDASLPYASTLQQAVQPGGLTPSADKAATLQEFLRTQSFVDKVAQRATNSQQVNEAAAAAMAKSITVATAGPQILTLSAKQASPVMAAGTLRALIDEFTAELGAVFKDRARASVSANKAALDAAASAVASAQNANDLALAQQQQAAAQDRYNQAQLNINGAVDPSAFHVVDPPRVPTVPASRKKALLMSGIGGLLGGGVITILVLVLVMAQDRSVREEKDVESALDLEVVSTVPQFDKSVLSPGGRRRQDEPHEWFWTPPGLVESCTVALRRLEREEAT